MKAAVPEYFSFASSAYEHPSLVFRGDHILVSAEGVQQGDPLGPFLFCITIQTLVEKLKSDFVYFTYMMVQ